MICLRCLTPSNCRDPNRSWKGDDNWAGQASRRSKFGQRETTANCSPYLGAKISCDPGSVQV